MTARRLGAVLAAALAVACSDSTGPTAGELVVTLAGATPPRAVQFRLVGPAEAFVAPAGSGIIVYAATVAGDTQAVAVVAPTGSALAPGPIVRVLVPDIGQASRYKATVLQAAGSSYALVSATGYSLTVTRP
jgi:hypothetical protein